MILAPFFPYYGSCHSMARLYPRPRFDRLIEPFAGSVCYSLHHPERDVVLVERDPVIAELWRYLIRVSPAEVLALPDLEPGQSTDDLPLECAARSLIGFWLNAGVAVPCKQMAEWHRRKQAENRPSNYWCARARHRIARQLPAIRHWTIVEGEAMATVIHSAAVPWEQLRHDTRGGRLLAIHGAATWFVDPPYIGRAGSHYRYGSKLIDYGELGAWCQALPGQVMVREQLGATWLPFERLGTVHGQRGKSTEVAWFSCQEDRPGYRQPELF